MNIKDECVAFVRAVKNKDYTTGSNIFNHIMSEKVDQAILKQRDIIAQSVKLPKAPSDE